jgi:hypothetical protein
MEEGELWAAQVVAGAISQVSNFSKERSMNVHEYIRNFADEAEVDVTTEDVTKIAAILKTANFRGDMSERDQELARSIVATRLGRVSGSKGKVETAAKDDEKEKKPSSSSEKKKDRVVEGYKDVQSFEKIDAMVKQGKCARCGQPTEKVALADYEEVQYCPGCRTTLW